MANFETGQYFKQLYGSCDYTKVWINEETTGPNSPPIVTDTDGIQYELLQCLGHGFEGEVWKVQETDGQVRRGPIYALKFEIGDVVIGEHLKSEYQLLKSLENPFIVKPIKYWYSRLFQEDEWDYPRGHLLMQYINGRPLNETQLTPLERKQVLLDLISVIKYLNQKINIAHRDIKSDNILIVRTQDLVFPILIDFGFPLPIQKDSLIDRKSLGLIYLEMIGLTPDQIYQFKTNINWYQSIDQKFSESQIRKWIPSDAVITPDQIKTFVAFFDGTDHDSIYQLIRETDFYLT